jgi:molybdopterin synthase catalytic subunit
MAATLTSRAISVARAYAALDDRASGGVVVFVGRVRPDLRRGQRITALFYDADRRMSMAAMDRLEREVRRRFSARRVVLWHRLGTIPVGEPSVIVGVAAAHRADAFAACRYLIDRLKQDVPIWKADRVRRARRPRRPRRRRAGR